jgi:hypothetical protein
LLARYLEACAGLAVDRIDNTPLIAVDLELTGRDTHRDHIVSMGWAEVDGGRIRIGSSRHLLVVPPPGTERGVGHSAVIHELRDSDVAGARSRPCRPVHRRAGRWSGCSSAELMHPSGIRPACAVGAAPPFIALDTCASSNVCAGAAAPVFRGTSSWTNSVPAACRDMRRTTR